MAMTYLVIVVTGERIPLTDGDAAEGSEMTANSFIIADAMMKSLSSSLATSYVLGATGSSECRRKSRSPTPGSVTRAERRAPGTPQSRSTRHSGVSLASTPPRNVALTPGAYPDSGDEEVLCVFH